MRVISNVVDDDDPFQDGPLSFVTESIFSNTFGDGFLRPISNSLFRDKSSDDVLLFLTNTIFGYFGDYRKMFVTIDHSNEFLMTLCDHCYSF